MFLMRRITSGKEKEEKEANNPVTNQETSQSIMFKPISYFLSNLAKKNIYNASFLSSEVYVVDVFFFVVFFSFRV